MRMIYSPYYVDIQFVENQPVILVIEHPMMFQRLLSDLWKQLEGGEGDWILSQQEKNLSISKSVVGIYNPFVVDCNEKRILNKVYAELAETAMINYPVETAELNGRILEYLDNLMQDMPYHLESRMDMDISALLKCYGVEIERDQASLIEKIADYLRAMHLVCRIDLFVFVNLRQYLLDDELKHLYEFAAYEKIHILLIEGCYPKTIFNESIWIYDRDLCMIHIDN
ncbi:MAG: type II-A CRISPR-associated protein Csn2 [Lachnospiraceae bacterium]|nr:type II-A CRISPR-associated protein Csn2 [Lachnospiraceae bacterium]